MDIEPYEADEDLFEATRLDGQLRHRVYSPDRVMVVLGRGSKQSVELNEAACAEDQVPLLRRRGGGCSVVLDPGNIIVAAAIHAPGISGSPAYFDRFSKWLIRGLERVGVVGLGQNGGSDLTIGDRKIGGACMYRSRDTLLYGVSLLVRPDVSLMERYLSHPPREPDYRRGRRHSDFVGAIGPALWPESVELLTRRLQDSLSR